MNEGENLLIVALVQLGCIPKDSEITSFIQITNEEFFKILVKCCKKIISFKGLEINFPDLLPKEMNLKYKEAQKMVEFIKSIGYKPNLTLNNILFPSFKDMQKILEFILESITNMDSSNVLEIGQNFSENNLARMKLVKNLSNWTKETWVVPELTHYESPKTSLIISSKISSFKKGVYNTQLKANKNKEGFTQFYGFYQDSETLLEDHKERVVFLKGENELDAIKKSEIVNDFNNKLKDAGNKNVSAKTLNQQLIEAINTRQLSYNFSYLKEKENIVVNNIKIIESQYFKSSATSKIESTSKEEYSPAEQMQPQSNTFKTKIDNIIGNYEKEREAKIDEINELNTKLIEKTKSLNDTMKKFNENNQRKNEIEQLFKDKNEMNKDILKELESKLEIFEKYSKIEKKEENMNDLGKEVEVLEKRYNEMTRDWTEYSQQIQSRKEELTNLIETTKKEYKFKYEKINKLKAEIEEINNKVALKQELANFLSEEQQKIPLDINRNIFISRISTLTSNISSERQNITGYLKELSSAENQINSLNDTFKRVDNELEDKLFQDAKTNSTNKEFYSLFIRIRDGYNIIQKNIIDSHNVKNKLKEIENKLDDYNLKTKSFDLEQLKKQVDELKNENRKK